MKIEYYLRSFQSEQSYPALPILLGRDFALRAECVTPFKVYGSVCSIFKQKDSVTT